MDSDRGTGRTTKMLRDLGEGRSIVIVPNGPMRDYVLHLVRHLNEEGKGARNVVAKAITHPSDVDTLRGLSCPIVVDHAFWEMARPDVAAAVSQILAHHNARMARA